jgi:3-oxoacyl-ACP reductase-like protein
MGNRLQVVGKAGVLAPAGVVDQLMRHAKMPGAHRRVNAAHRVDRKNRLGTGVLQRPEIGAVIHPVRGKAVRLAMPGEKQHFVAGVLADLHLGRRRAVGSVQRQ